MVTKIAFAAVIAATLVAAATLIAAPVLAGQSNGETATTTKASSNIAAQGWCTGPRQHMDFRCL